MKRLWMMLFIILFVSACSSSTVKEDLQKEPQNEMIEQDVKEDRAPPESVTFTSQLPKSYVTKSSVDVSEAEKTVITALNEFKAEEIGGNTKLTLPEGILFDFDSEQLRPESGDAIQKLAHVISLGEGAVEIVGHTDSKGADDYNQQLSERRAQAVFNALIEQGIPENRLTTAGKGASEPVAQNALSNGSDNPEGRQKNRRVEVTIHDFNH
ncbi:hypothetical protein BEP19_15390 [Ammoniphilus oxalaticus]|uniref:OmpA-like domain-containing protein n=1 Tax=Ammoniphilus oxalaticus TaxID=66863 RepID=A0A419SDJ5_9BACL|nr:OmpA family protein [Ammoniphilus oxalaticus]RKD21060.1 hypothetical protein BEP19_15390 [Ammoniphilus oxalaticus]